MNSAEYRFRFPVIGSVLLPGRTKLIRLSGKRGPSQPVADVLQAHMRDLDADLLIMGAFGHSRMREFILGGATQGILDNLQVPVLFSH
ncbi:universal stress protein [Azospirillum aestuarii]|nr:universal stress protein [Azospirillum aestuarii]